MAPPLHKCSRMLSTVYKIYQRRHTIINGDAHSAGNRVKDDIAMVINWQKVSIEHDSIKFQIEIQLWNPKL